MLKEVDDKDTKKEHKKETDHTAIATTSNVTQVHKTLGSHHGNQASAEKTKNQKKRV